MKKRIFSLLVVLVMAVSVVIGVSLTSSAADGDGLKNSAISLAENVTLKMEVAIAEPAEGAYAKVTLPGGAVDATQLVANAPKNGSNYVFFAEVAVKDLAKDVTIEICNADGSTLVAAATTSALAYCDTYTEGEFLALVTALKAYANAADYYFDAAKNADDADAPDFTDVADAAFAGELPAGVTHRSATLLLESETTIRHYFELAEGKSVYNYTFFVDVDEDGKCDMNERVTPSSKEASDGKTVYYVDIASLTPNMLDDTYTVGVTDGDKLYTCTYGVLTYLKRAANASNDAKNLAAAILAYSDAAGELVGKITFNADGGSAVADQSYEYGVAKPIVAPTAKDGAIFLGWADASGKIIDTIPASAAGNVALTAKWASIVNRYDASSKTSATRFYCNNHKDTSDPADGICDVCGYCVDNASCTLVKFDATAACAKCGKAKIGSGNLADIDTSSSDKGHGYAQKITDTSGKEVLMFGVAQNAFYENFNGASDKKLSQLAAEAGVFAVTIEVGLPTADQYGPVEVNPSKVLGDQDGAFIFRISGAGGADTVFSVGGGKAYISGDSSKYVTLPRGKVTKLTVVFDFTGAVAGDKEQDSYSIALYDENGNLVNAKTVALQQKVYKDWKTGAETTSSSSKYNGETKNNTHIYTGDISKYSGYLFQFRTTSKGRFLLGDIDVVSASPFTTDVINAVDGTKLGNYTPGVAYELPETLPEKNGATFGGWFADSEYRQPIDKVGANAVGSVSVYPLWLKTVGINNNPSISAGQVYFEDNTYYGCYDLNSDGKCDACEACLHKGALVNATCATCGNKVVQDCDRKKHTDEDSDGWCDVCHFLVTRNATNHPTPTGAQAIDGIFMGTGNQIGANIVVVENGDNDYYKVTGMGGGPSFNAQSSTSIEDLLNSSIRLGLGKKVSMSIQLARIEGTATAGMSLRTRSYKMIDGTNTADSMDVLELSNNGTLTFKSTGGSLKSGKNSINLTETMQTIDIVFDFEANTMSFYVDGVLAAVYANSKVSVVYDAESGRYETPGWCFDGTGDNALNGRINNLGVTLIGDTYTVPGDITQR